MNPAEIAAETAACDYCGLPAGARPSGGAVGPVYCCYGCRFAAAVVQESGEVGRLRWNLTRLGLGVFFSMNVMVFTLVLWSLDLFPQEASPKAAQAELLWDLFRYLCMLFSLPVLLLLGGPLLENAWHDLRRGRWGADLLLLGGVAAAYAYSAVSVFTGEGHVYFEVGCMILVSITLGRWLEATGKWKATDALKSLWKLLPEEVEVETPDGFKMRLLDAVGPGDRVRVAAGDRIPVDGRIEAGRASLDEQLITGESLPCAKQPGDEVYGGTLNLDGRLVIRASAAAAEGSLQRLIDAVVLAAAAGDRWRRLADRAAAWFTPLVLAIALATLAGHWWASGFQHGLLSGLAVLLIACPCALGVATPMAIWAGMGAASRRGVLFRNGDALARLASVRAFCFDKTGTLTDGLLTVDRLVCPDLHQSNHVLQVALQLSAASNHVISQAIQQYAAAHVPDRSACDSAADIKTIPGLGVQAADTAGGPLLLGSQRLLQEHGIGVEQQLQDALADEEAEDRACCLVAWDGRAQGLFLLRERLRPSAAEGLRQLHARGVSTQVLTGDRLERGRRLAAELGVPVQAQLLPEEKLSALACVQAAHGPTAMVGDGVNDAPALAAADVGVALSCGADVSRDAADVCLVHDDLTALAWAVDLAGATQRTIRQNLAWAFGYNAVGVGLAAAGWLNPMLAAVAMVGSSLFVVSNSLKLAGQAEADSELGQTDPASSREPTVVGDGPADYIALPLHDKGVA